MVTAEALYQKAKELDADTLQEVYDFLDFLAHKQKADFQRLLDEKRRYFPETSLAPADQRPIHTTRTLSLEDMDAAIEFEAGLRK